MEYELIADENSVRLWSDKRLPFEPKGEVRAMRDALRSALGGLSGSRLLAAFGGPAGANFDIENVLFYNVGCAAFRACSQQELYFERRFVASSSPSGRSWRWSHEYRTDVMPKSWTSTERELEFKLNGEGSLPATAGEYWRAAHMSNVSAEDDLPGGVPLLLRLHLSSGRPVNLTEAVKKVTDGICSALHTYVGTRLDDVASRAGTILDIRPETAKEWLTRAGALGPRQYVWPFGGNLQWSPADERLVAVEMSWSPSGSNAWALDVTLSGAEPTAP